MATTTCDQCNCEIPNKTEFSADFRDHKAMKLWSYVVCENCFNAMKGRKHRAESRK